MRIQPVTRGTPGGDAIHCAAYRGGRNLWNERTGDYHKWGGREDVHDVGIVLPQAVADDPAYDWAKDPYKLWNTAEFAEVQGNGRVAREYMVLLPAEMTQAQRRDVVYRFARILADRYHNAIDVALHDRREGRARNYHAHLLATTRKVGPTGLLEKTDAEVAGSIRQARELSDAYRQLDRSVRRLWDQMLWKAIEQAGLEPEVHGNLYRAYGTGETTSQYHRRLMLEGYDLKKQQREDRLKTQHTAEERRQSAEKKFAIRKFRRLQGMAREEKKYEVECLRRAGTPLQGPERHKRTWLPRWDADGGLLLPWEVERQRRRVGETQAMVPWNALEDPGPEPQFEPEPEFEMPVPDEPRDIFAEEIRELECDPVLAWLAYKPAKEHSRQRVYDGPEYAYGQT